MCFHWWNVFDNRCRWADNHFIVGLDGWMDGCRFDVNQSTVRKDMQCNIVTFQVKVWSYKLNNFYHQHPISKFSSLNPISIFISLVNKMCTLKWQRVKTPHVKLPWSCELVKSDLTSQYENSWYISQIYDYVTIRSHWKTTAYHQH